MEVEPQPWQKQPEQNAIVWQHNRLAEARYELTAREQKLLLYVIAMIESEDADFKRYIVNVSEFAELASLDKDHLYRELRDLAKGLKQKPLVIPNHFDTETGTYVDLVTNWFDAAYVGRNGAGYFAVRISRDLRPYLLQVKREFFQFRLNHVMRLRSGYAIRLYQWAKRWAFRKSIKISVAELRFVLGATSSEKDGGGRTSLASYADFKRRAIKPAVDEITSKTDLAISFREIKARGSKAVEGLGFSIRGKKGGEELEIMQLPPPPQLELELAGRSQGEQLVGELAARYGLNGQQRRIVEGHLHDKGEEYVRNKAAIVDQEPRENAARAFLAALRDDWQPAMKRRKEDKRPTPTVLPVTSPEEEAEMLKRIKEEAAAFRQKVNGVEFEKVGS
jgi:plasmid replication initiation protein